MEQEPSEGTQEDDNDDKDEEEFEPKGTITLYPIECNVYGYMSYSKMILLVIHL